MREPDDLPYLIYPFFTDNEVWYLPNGERREQMKPMGPEKFFRSKIEAQAFLYTYSHVPSPDHCTQWSPYLHIHPSADAWEEVSTRARLEAYDWVDGNIEEEE